MAEKHNRMIKRAARKHGIPAKWLYGLWGAEHGLRERGFQTSKSGARGPFQFMPATARSYGINPYKFGQAADAAAKYLATYKGRGLEGMYRAYNAGPAGGPNPESARHYAAALRYMKQWPGADLKGGGGKSSRGSLRGQMTGDVTVQGAMGSAGSGSSLGAVSLLAKELARPAAPPASSLPSPEFSAAPALPKTYRDVPSTGSAQVTSDLASKLAALSELRGPDLPNDVTVPGGRVKPSQARRAARKGMPGRLVGGGRRSYPLGKPGSLIGAPYGGTHTLGNWQSDNAVDLGVPVGTPVYAMTDGQVTKTGGSGSMAGRFGGYNLTIGGPRNSFFYTHLSKLRVRPGQRVRKGQLIGFSGSANGVPHLHLGVQRGDPRNLLR